jgi:hypothetical protein
MRCSAALSRLSREEMRHDRRHGAAHAARQRLDHGHVLAEFRRDRRELQSDEAGAGDDDPLRSVEARLDRVGLGERTEIEYAVGLGAGHRQLAVLRAGREHEMVVGESLAGGECDAARDAVDRNRPVAGHDRNGVLLVIARLPQLQALGGGLAEQIGLR